MASFSLPRRGAEVERTLQTEACETICVFESFDGREFGHEKDRGQETLRIDAQLARCCRSSHAFKSDARKRHIFPTWEP